MTYEEKSVIVIEQLRADRDRLLGVLDKIRAEIIKEVINYSGTGEEIIQAYADGLKKGLDIIDKYKSESDKENE